MNANKMNSKRILFPIIDGFFICARKKIVRIEAEGRFSVLYCSNKKDPIKILQNISRICRLFEDDPSFFYCHRSHLVNLKFVEKLETKLNRIHTTKGIVPISRSRSIELKNKTHIYMSIATI